MEEQDIQLEAWYTAKFGDFKIIKKRFGTFTSYDRQGNSLVTGGTAKSVFEMTPAHLRWAVEGYNPPAWLDGEEVKTYSASAGVKL